MRKSAPRGVHGSRSSGPVSRWPSRLARGAAFAAVCALAGCTQDGYSSNPNDRETHMGDIRAAAPPPSASAAPAPVAPAPVPAPSASQ